MFFGLLQAEEQVINTNWHIITLLGLYAWCVSKQFAYSHIQQTME